jgi:hypothetical protein
VTFLVANRGVNPATSFWFGRSYGIYSHELDQVSVPSASGANLGFAFGWKRCVVPPLGSLNFTFIVHSLPISSPPVLTLTGTIPSRIQASDSLTIRGTVQTAVFADSISLVAVIDADPSSRHYVWASSISSQAPFEVSVPISELPIGQHWFTVYAVDLTGAVSEGTTFLCDIILATPVLTPSPFPTPTRRVTQSPTATSSRVPTYAEAAPPEAEIDIYAATNGYNFNIVGKSGGVDIRSTFGNTGYRTVVWVDGTPFQLVGCQTVSNSDATISTTISKGSSNVSITFRLANGGSVVKSFQLVLTGRCAIGTDDHPGVVLNSWNGFNVSSEGRQFAWACGPEASPMVRNADPAFGTVAGQSGGGEPSGWERTLVSDTAAGLSYQADVPANSFRTFTITVTLNAIRPAAMVYRASVSSAAIPGFSVSAAIAGSGPLQSSQLAVVAVPGGEVLGTGLMYCWSTECSTTISISVPMTWFSGTYDFRVAVLDVNGPGGTSLSAQTFQIEVIGAPGGVTPSPRPSKSAVRSPVRTIPATVWIEYTSFFTRRKTRVRKIFAFSYLIPAILNR